MKMTQSKFQCSNKVFDHSHEKVDDKEIYKADNFERPAEDILGSDLAFTNDTSCGRY